MQKMQRATFVAADKRRTRQFGGRGGLSLRVAGASVAKQTIEDVGDATAPLPATGQTSFGDALVASQAQTEGVQSGARFVGSQQHPIRSGERIRHTHSSHRDSSDSSAAPMSNATVSQSVIP